MMGKDSTPEVWLGIEAAGWEPTVSHVPLHSADLPAFFGPPVTGEQRRSDRLVVCRALPRQREPASPASAHRKLGRQDSSL